MKKYTKKSGNPEKDGLYDTNKGLYLFYQGDWYWQFRDGWTMAQYNTLPLYYFDEEAKECANGIIREMANKFFNENVVERYYAACSHPDIVFEIEDRDEFIQNLIDFCVSVKNTNQ